MPNVKLVAEREMIEAVPVPDRLMVCGLFRALSVIVTAPVRVPIAVGVKVTVIVQFAPGATEAPQVVVFAKSPVAVILVMSSVPLPVFVSVTDCAALVVPTRTLPNLRLVVERPTTGARPVPVRLTDCGLPDALSVIVIAPVRVPEAFGVNVTLMVQLVPGFIVALQLLACA